MIHSGYYVGLFIFGSSNQEFVLHALIVVWASHFVDEFLQSVSAVGSPWAQVRRFPHSPPCSDLEGHQTQPVPYSKRSKNKVK